MVITSTNLTKSANALTRALAALEATSEQLTALGNTPLDDSEVRAAEAALAKNTRALTRWNAMADAGEDDPVTAKIATEQISRLEAEKDELESKLEKAMEDRQKALYAFSKNQQELKEKNAEEYDKATKAYEAFQRELEKFETSVAESLEISISSASNKVSAAEEKLPEERVETPIEVVEQKPESKVEPEATNQEIDFSVLPEEVLSEELDTLLGVMKRFHNAANEYDPEIVRSGEYSNALRAVWNDVKLSQPEKNAIKSLCNSEEIKGLTKEQTHILKSSLPAELLGLCGMRDFAEKRALDVPGYYDGFLNKWRPAFTYAIVSQLCDLVASHASAGEISSFFTDNMDSKEKGKHFPYFEKVVIRAFANV